MREPCRCPHAAFSATTFAHASRALGRGAFLRASAGVLAGALLARPTRAANEPVTVLRAARLFDGTAMRAPGVLVVRGDRIVSLMAGDAGSTAHTVDLGDATLMPGLIDCHTHVCPTIVVSSYALAVFPPGLGADSPAQAAIVAVRNAQLMLRNGFTTLRDVGGSAGVDIALRNAIADGVVVGPRLHVAGTYFGVSGGGADLNDVPDFLHVDPSFQAAIANGPDAFRGFVREHARRHVDHIKIIATGAVMSYGDTFDVPQFDADEVRAIVTEANKFGLRVAAHAHGDRGCRIAVEAGVHSIEHGTGVSAQTAHDMRARGTVLVPTLWALDSILQPGNPNHVSENSVAKARQAIALRDAGLGRALAAGVTVAYGSDAGVFPHHENNRDFALMTAKGMAPLDVLRSATSTAAALLGVDDRGALAVGMLADVVAFAGDPLRDLAALERPPVLTMLGGRTLDPATLAP